MTEDQARRIAGRYRIDSVLGRGGMSVVYEGYDEHLDRAVAIKLLNPHPPVGDDVPGARDLRDARTRDRERFLREIRTTARLELAGVPSVYDAGSDGAAELWVVMQLLRGSTLQTVLDRTEATDLSVARAAAVAAQIAAVLVDVHRVDVVHRDVKPANIVVTDSGLVKVLDFGIAILHGQGALPRLTQVDCTDGSPAYMSPEQHLGQPVTAASDVYSLGCVLCELLTGDPPFHDSVEMPLRARHLQTAPPSVRDAVAAVPVVIDELVLAMLAKAPGLRPSAEQVYAVLEPWCTGDQPETEQDPTRPFRRPLLPPRTSASERDSVGQPLTEAEVDALRDEALGLVQEGREHEAVQLVEAAVRRKAEDAFVEVRLRHCLADTLFAAGEFRGAAPLFIAVGREYRRFLGPTNLLSLDCDHDAGLAYAEIGDHVSALPQLQRFVDHAGPDDARLSEARAVLAGLHLARGATSTGLAILRQLRRQVAATEGADSPQARALDRRPRLLGEGEGT
ncbi:serine/threonine-protein kinase [Actinomycetospora sp. NBRC 106378]|uniref:serine/threonine-protein kinase n=1 Tax=Actinomycetospora sp. NBRC 106378 TaxID=3032208 RepID=UPI0024A0E19C|nr:serine/threonine-protein kinase [Actinomycetospora sp. NBRC 106378]GLZ54132.1 hypothetical protein Acsp07_37490 [Actinomycetospora sp. NBRC 106378]